MKYLSIRIVNKDEISIFSTKEEIFAWIAENIHHGLPAAICEKTQAPSVKKFSNLHHSSQVISYWLYNRLCQMGWQPFGVKGTISGEGLEYQPEYHLRLV